MAKIKSNEEVFRDFIQNVDAVTLAVIRAIIVSNAEQALKNQEAVRADHENAVFSGDLIIDANKEIVKYLGFD